MPRSTPARGAKLTLRVTLDTFQRLTAEAQSAGVTLSEYLRPRLEETGAAETRELRVQLARLEEKILRLEERREGENAEATVREISEAVEKIPVRAFGAGLGKATMFMSKK